LASSDAGNQLAVLYQGLFRSADDTKAYVVTLGEKEEAGHPADTGKTQPFLF